MTPPLLQGSTTRSVSSISRDFRWSPENLEKILLQVYPAEKMSALSVFKFFYSIFEWGTLAEIADTDYRGFFLSIDFYHFLSCLHFRFRLFLKISSWRRILNFSSSKSFLKDKSFDTSFMGHCCLDIVQKNHHFSYLKTPGRNQNSTLDTYVRSIRSYKKFLSVLLKETWT